VPQTGLPKTQAVYRPGAQGTRAGQQPVLVREWAPVTSPFSERQSLDALLSTPPVESGLSTAGTSGTITVASVRQTTREILVDLSANDTTIRPRGSDAREVAERWVQAWVYTLHDAYDSELPVRVTLQGRPTTLFGHVDTGGATARSAALKVIRATASSARGRTQW
jgi:hypothetical protein